MNEQEFTRWCSKLGCSEEAIGLISNIRASNPSRLVGGGKKNVPGTYASKKMGVGIQFESHKVEFPGVYLKEHSNDVLEYYDQPPSIKLKYNSKNDKVIGFYHTPDYFVIKMDTAGWEEWKTKEELERLSKDSPNRYVCIDGVWRCPPGELFAKKYGLYYWVKCSDEINWKLQRNITFLEDYFLDTITQVSLEVIEIVLSSVRNEPGITLSKLLNTFNVTVDDIYYLIAREQIYVDLEEELLTQRDRTHVFVDEQTSLAYKVMTSTRRNAILETHSVQVAPGTRVLWEGSHWTIINLGERSISLMSLEGNIIELPRDVFYNLICDKKLIGIDDNILKSTPTFVKSILNEASEADLEIANLRYQILSPILEGGKKPSDMDLEVTPRTILNWCKSYRQAEQEYGSGYIGLIPKIRNRGNTNKRLPKKMVEDIFKFIKENENPKNQKLKVLYGKVIKLCETKGYIPPSEKTFSKLIKQRPLKERTKNTVGSRIATSDAEEFYWELDMTIPRHGERPFEIAHIDHTEVDLETVHSVTGKRMGKFWLSLMVDAYSRRILAFYITFSEPSYRSDLMLIRECVRRFNRLPQIIVTDNGADFKSIYFQSLLTRYFVTQKRRPAHKARYGSIYERLFGTSNTQLFHNLMGNTKIMKNVRQVTKSVNPEKFAVWTLPALYELCKEYFYEFYDTSEHSSLGESPREAFEREMAVSGRRPFRYIAYDEDFIMMSLPQIKNGTAKVDHQRGIKVNNRYYYCEDFNRSDVMNTKVAARYDPWNMGIVYAYVRKKWVKCYSEYYSIFKDRTEEEVKIASEELAKQRKVNADKSKVSAKELGEFILKIEDTEKMLKQRLADLELEPQLIVLKGGNPSNGNITNVNYQELTETVGAIEDESGFNINEFSFEFEDEYGDDEG